jgi:hypothetical protein
MTAMNTIKLKDIISISGKGGLFKYIAQARNGIVVESIEDKKRHVAPTTARVSSLEDIAIFTEDEELPLADIFYMIHERTEGKETLSHKSPTAELKSFFEELVPDYDQERVYLSDIKKVFQWYNQLHSHDLLEVVEKEEEDSGAESEDSAAEKKGSAAKSEDSAAENKGSAAKSEDTTGKEKVDSK